MNGKRRGFISATVGLGAIFTGATGSANAASIGPGDVLIAMPGERYYAVPVADLERFAISAGTFEKEEAQRAAQASTSQSKDFSSKSAATRRPPPRPAAMGVRG